MNIHLYLFYEEQGREQGTAYTAKSYEAGGKRGP